MMWLLVTVLSVCIGRSVGLVCTMVDACSCTLDDGSGVIDVTSLGNTDTTPMFADQAGPDGYLYSVNLCQPFNEADCSNTAGCQLSQDKTTSYPIGDANSITYGMNSNNQVQLQFSSDGGGGSTRASTVTLACDQSKDQPEIQVNGETTPGIYEFTITTKCGCPNGCSGAPPPATTTPRPGPGPGPGPGPSNSGGSGGVSIGTILCIVVLSLGFVYLVGGMLFLRLQRQARGAEMVPNISLWSALPGLIKDGFSFVFRKIRGKSGYGKV